MSEAILSVQGLTMDFGGVRALDGVDLEVPPGEIVALIGPNGAGKTTLFNCASGLYAPTGGDIVFYPPAARPVSISGKKPNHITRLGLARTFQNIRLFGSMTVMENVMLGRHCRLSTGLLGALLRTAKVRREEWHLVSDCLELLDFVGLRDKADWPATALPYGEQRRLEIARALATDPCLLLLDEPVAGMNRRETQDMMALIEDARTERGVAVLLIEHDMKMVMRLSDTVYVLEHGASLAHGTPEEVAADPRVIEAYLGEEHGGEERHEAGGEPSHA